MTPSEPQPDRALLATIARRYLLQDQTKVEIARDLGLSRFKVARLLAEARERGIVRIEIVDDAGVDTTLSARLGEALDLNHAVVLADSASLSQPALARAMGTLAAAEVHRLIGERDVLGLPWSRKVSWTVSALVSLPPVPVVQLSGALTAVDLDSPVDIVRDAARLGGGPAHLFYAPLVATDADSAQMLRRQPSVADALAAADTVTLAVVGVGAWLPGRSTLFDSANADEHAQLAAAGAVGEVSGVFLDRDGQDVNSDLSARIIGASGAQLRRIGRVIGVVVGPEQADAVLAARRAGIVDTLVVDDELARRLLERHTQNQAELLHLAVARDWEAAQKSGRYPWSTRGRTVAEEGFVHLSTAEQWRGVRERFYGDLPDADLRLLHLDTSGLDVRWEVGDPATGEEFPHLYAELPVERVTRVTTLEARAGTE
ncbi:DUF952 domain-containing protein [Calidifontibacter sp. DB0510]|uniref:DUF952 domain-containing protein n=1 Tax=Metallococcus carri TaxID=1656884 RepID=A0A967B227_9MICO|nr:DUF952 domain-containing protein [Metallococcus carri]NHN57404.1 DUF952 domain-containing protein [Metallococcus carri]NOP39200.1 DUF952 domain-containing protein [Calidifontibacter sp. DB2511S]